MPLRGGHVAAVAVGVGALLQTGAALAQARNPFGVGISEGGGGTTGLTGWILAQQGWFEHQLSLGVRSVSAETGAIWWLAGVGFIYGVFHAAGPGHGKAVLASYMVANERALRRGIVLSVLAALLQGAVAILLVGTLAWALHATAQSMKAAAGWVELASFAGIACLGGWLVWRKAGAFARIWRDPPMVDFDEGGGLRAFGAAMVPFAPQQDSRRLAFAGPAPATGRRFECVAAEAAHSAGCICHAPDPTRLGGQSFSWREAGLTVVAAGARPCSGAILVLVFALMQGVFLAGVGAVLAMSVGVALTTSALASLAVLAKSVARRMARPGSRTGALLLSGLELAAAALVLCAGVGLLLGDAVVG